MCATSYFPVSFFYIFSNYNNNAIAHVHRVTYRGEVPSAHRELVQSTAATSRPTTPRPIRRRVVRKRGPSHLKRSRMVVRSSFSADRVIVATTDCSESPRSSCLPSSRLSQPRCRHHDHPVCPKTAPHNHSTPLSTILLGGASSPRHSPPD